MLSNEFVCYYQSEKRTCRKKDTSVKREKLTEIKLHDGFATIIAGIRRCGKSTLLQQLLPAVPGRSLFLNFEDPHLSGFERDDFRCPDNELKKGMIVTLHQSDVYYIEGKEIILLPV
ncbi:MAG: AAA family ATPase [Agriterribacter sp.]